MLLDAECADCAEAAALLARICQECERIHREKPRYPYVLRAWGAALVLRASRASAAEASRLYQSADEKLTLALRLAGGSGEPRTEQQAHLMARLARDDLFQGCRGDPTMDLFRPHGAMLHGAIGPFLPQHSSSTHEDAGGPSGRATQMPGAALLAAPDAPAGVTRSGTLLLRAYLLNAWGLNLMHQAREARVEEADRLYEMAGEKLTSALVITPDDAQIVANRDAAFRARADHQAG
jgi:hypothetical protein